MPEMTWKCEVCGRSRPYEKIVATHHQLSDVLTRNVRHCVDNELCVRAAADPDRWAIGNRSGFAADFSMVDDPFPGGYAQGDGLIVEEWPSAESLPRLRWWRLYRRWRRWRFLRSARPYLQDAGARGIDSKTPSAEFMACLRDDSPRSAP